MDKRTCSAEGCNEAVGGSGSARGLCKSHYGKWWRKNRKRPGPPGSSDFPGTKRTKGARLKKAAEKSCEQCGIPMKKPPNFTYGEWEKRRFCSYACRAKTLPPPPRPCHGRGQVELACAHCGKEFMVYPYQLEGKFPRKFCQDSCARAYRDQGQTPLNKRIRLSAEYGRWRDAVFKRDDYTCQFCGKRGVELNADHIKPFAYFPELRFDVDNGRTLCVPCHRGTETYGTGATRMFAAS